MKMMFKKRFLAFLVGFKIVSYKLMINRFSIIISFPFNYGASASAETLCKHVVHDATVSSLPYNKHYHNLYFFISLSFKFECSL